MALDGYENAFDFVLAFAVVHELPSAETFFAEAARAMKPGASLLLAEPAGHVGDDEFGGPRFRRRGRPRPSAGFRFGAPRGGAEEILRLRRGASRSFLKGFWNRPRLSRG